MSAGRRIRGEHGFVLPTRLMVFSISAVALGGLAFVATQSDQPDVSASNVGAVASPTPSAAPKSSAAPEVVATPSATPAAPTVKKRQSYVVIFNNSNVKGLAGKTSERAQRAGWNVVGSDNWYGTVDTSTVYFGEKMKPGAQQLAKDLGITTIKPAIKPMRPDRLTVILTADYQ